MNEQKIIDVNNLVRSKSRTELVQMCKERSLCASGTKHDMAVRLMGGWDKEKPPHLESSTKHVIIKKNQHGQWEFQRIVFDNKTKNAIGFIDEDGSVVPLQRKHIDICKQYKFKYELPQKLDDNPDPNTHNISSSDEEDEDDDDDVEEEEED